MTAAILVFYGAAAAIAFSNLLLMRRPRGGGSAEIAILIPARNEAKNLALLVPELVRQGAKVYVYDDESSDGTAEAAARAGATVVRATCPPPPGWVGKNRACHELAKIVIEDFAGAWICFLDADVHPRSNFVDAMRGVAERSRAPLITGFPAFLPGRGAEPLFMGWVGWILLATNPFGIVDATGLGHSRFANGQVQLWRLSDYAEIWPHEQVRSAVLEDVKIGRLMARLGQRVEVLNLSGVLGVRMYENWRQALDGMSKNSYEIVGSDLGTIGLSIFLLGAAWGWLAAGWAGYGLFVLGAAAAARICRFPLWTIPFAPLMLTIGSWAVARSLVWRKTGRVVWRGRTYG